MSYYSSIESAKTIVKTSNLSEAESPAVNQVTSSFQPLLSFNSKANAKPAKTFPIFNSIAIYNFLNYGKPNAILRPVIRKSGISDDMTALKSDETIIPLSSQVNVLKKDNKLQIKRKGIDSFDPKLNIKHKHLPKDKKNLSENVKIIV